QRCGQFFAPVSNMSSSAYISNGFGINYYTASAMHQPYAGPQFAASSSATASPLHHQPSGSGGAGASATGSTTTGSGSSYPVSDTGLRRRLFAGFRPLSGYGLLRKKSSQNRSISLPETSTNPKTDTARPFGEPLMLPRPILKSPETSLPDVSRARRRGRLS
ncbi:Hypothetical predicted protein, partial [Drosophila guanche]